MTILRLHLYCGLEVVLLFNLLIGVHELGHFLAAKWRGLKIDRFAIWFGKPVWKKKIGGVEYALGWIPAGGYVALPQMATMEAIEGKTEDAAPSSCRMSRRWTKSSWRLPGRCSVSAWRLCLLSLFGAWASRWITRAIPRSLAGWIRAARHGRRVCAQAIRFSKWMAIR